MRRLIRSGILLAALGAFFTPPLAAADGPKTLRFIPQADLRILDPVWTSAYITQHHAYLVYDTLFALDEHMKPQPQMIDHWTVSDDKRAYTFTLRDGLKFHDGLPVLPADCIASIARWGKRDVFGQKLMETVEAMTPIDDKSFKISLKQPFPLIIDALAKLHGSAFIMPERVAKTDADKQITDFTGSGPFKLVKEEWEPGHKVVYAKFADYLPRGEKASWVAGGKVAKFDRVEWIYIPDSATAAAALNNGEVDWWELVPTELLPVFAANKSVIVNKKPDPLGTLGLLRFNQLQPPFNNEKMRQAFLYAVDQREYMAAVAGDPENWRTCYSFFTCGTALANDAGTGAIAGKRDLEKASPPRPERLCDRPRREPGHRRPHAQARAERRGGDQRLGHAARPPHLQGAGRQRRVERIPHLDRRPRHDRPGTEHPIARQRARRLVRLAERRQARGLARGVVRGTRSRRAKDHRGQYPGRGL